MSSDINPIFRYNVSPLASRHFFVMDLTKTQSELLRSRFLPIEKSNKYSTVTVAQLKHYVGQLFISTYNIQFQTFLVVPKQYKFIM